MTRASFWFERFVRGSHAAREQDADSAPHGDDPEQVRDAAEALPRSTEGRRLYILPDIHGRLDALDKALARIESDVPDHRRSVSLIVCLGDYVDRGGQSAEVIDRLIDLGRSRPLICLKGNHEAMMIETLLDPDRLGSWNALGGNATLASYRVRPPKRSGINANRLAGTALQRAVPAYHRDFLNGLLSSWSCGSFFFAHAGIRPGIDLASQLDADLLWIRDEFLDSRDNHGKLIVHGHTVVRTPELQPNRINLDTGAYATGNLTCLLLDGDELRFI